MPDKPLGQRRLAAGPRRARVSCAMPTPDTLVRTCVALVLAACAGQPSAAPPAAAPMFVAPNASVPVEAPPLPIASDALADSVLVDVRSVDSTIQVDARYADA